MRRLIVVALAGCWSHAEAPTSPQLPPVEPSAEPARPTRAPATLSVQWGEVTRTPGCFFFSGPEGRDDKLVGAVVVETVERDNDRLKLLIGTATFEGTYASGDLNVTRTSIHDHNGPWTVTERITGSFREGELTATYTYEECQQAATQCPGNCSIQGELAFSRRL